jgi:hypothetical protein
MSGFDSRPRLPELENQVNGTFLLDAIIVKQWGEQIEDRTSDPVEREFSLSVPSGISGGKDAGWRAE